MNYWIQYFFCRNFVLGCSETNRLETFESWPIDFYRYQARKQWHRRQWTSEIVKATDTPNRVFFVHRNEEIIEQKYQRYHIVSTAKDCHKRVIKIIFLKKINWRLKKKDFNIIIFKQYRVINIQIFLIFDDLKQNV